MPSFKMPDGSFKDFQSVDEARSFRSQNFPNFQKPQPRAEERSPINSEAMKVLEVTGGDIGAAKDVAALNKATQESQDPRESVERILSSLEGTLSKIPSGEKGLPAMARGYWEKVKGKTGYSPDVGTYEGIRKGTLSPLIRYLGEKGALAEGDVERAIGLIPGVEDPYTYRRQKYGELRTILGFPQSKSSLSPAYIGPRKRPSVRAPQSTQTEEAVQEIE